MISLINLSKHYGTRALFDDVSLSIVGGERLGLVGPNGAGKTTLFSLITGKMESSNGMVQIHKNTRIGYLPQESCFNSSHTVLGELLEGDEQITSLKKEKLQLEHSDKAGSQRYGQVLHELEHLGYFEMEHKAKKILSGLGFKERDFNRPISELSGGWQMRALLARLLTCYYDILLLDEPTNYLDLNAALWFKDYLGSFKGSFIMISHDRAFLDDVTDGTLVLENGALTKVRGNYQQYERIRDQQVGFLTKRFEEQEKKKEQLQRFIDRFHGQPSKAAQVRSKRKAMERMEEINLPEQRRESIRTFAFPATRSSGYKVMDLRGISKSYGDICVYKDFSLEITRGEKAVLAGENGAGKSTLLKIMAGVVPVDNGQRAAGHNVDIGYFSQSRLDVLNLESTVIDEAYSAAGGKMAVQTLRTILGAFLFSGDDVDKKVKVLSGGEKSRLILAKLLINPPNFLLLDEPTTHLDVDAVQALIKALQEYQGTLVFISHDIYFVRSLANEVFHVEGGEVRKFPGNFDDYLKKRDSGQLFVDPAQVSKNVLPDIALPNSRGGTDAGTGDISKESHNAKVANTIKKLRKQKEKLESELYAKQRVAANPRHGDDVIRFYDQQIKDLQDKITGVDIEINRMKSKFVN